MHNNTNHNKCIDPPCLVKGSGQGGGFVSCSPKYIIKKTNTPHNINKFALNMDIIISGSQSTFLNALWTNNFFDNNMKMFLFKLHNNTLGYNNAVAHFVAGHSPCCTFCDAAGDADINPETGLHLFFDCAHVSELKMFLTV